METKTKHTPGPWQIRVRTLMHDADVPDADAYIGVDIPNSCGKDVAKICGWGDKITRCPEMQANANLIAAAPELLEALERIVQHSDEWGYTTIAEIARAAIAKSKGAA